MTQFNKESDNENGKKRKWFCKYNKKGNMFGTAGLQWKEADLITICKPSAHMQTSKHRKNCECCPGHYLSTSVY